MNRHQHTESVAQYRNILRRRGKGEHTHSVTFRSKESATVVCEYVYKESRGSIQCVISKRTCHCIIPIRTWKVKFTF